MIGLHVAIGLLAIIFVPLAMDIIGLVRSAELHMSIAPVARVVFMTVLIPLAVGIGVHKLAPALAERLSRPIALISGIGLLASIVAVWISAAPAMWSLIGNGAVIALVAFVLVGLTIGHFLGGPKHGTALAISTATRHPGIALALAQANFPAEKLVTAAVLLYLIVNAIVSIPYLLWTKRRQANVEVQVRHDFSTP